MAKERNWLVLFQANNEIGVDTMKVIDSWSSNQSIQEARNAMWQARPQYLAKYGHGRMMVVESAMNVWFRV